MRVGLFLLAGVALTCCEKSTNAPSASPPTSESADHLRATKMVDEEVLKPAVVYQDARQRAQKEINADNFRQRLRAIERDVERESKDGP